jgi:hypothetical protein
MLCCSFNSQRTLSYLFFSIVVTVYSNANVAQQRVGIGTNNPQANLDVVNTFRAGGNSRFIFFDSLSGKFNLKNSHLFVADSQHIIRHSNTQEGMFYANGKFTFMDSLANPIFSMNLKNGNSLFSGKVGMKTLDSLRNLNVGDSLRAGGILKYILYDSLTGKFNLKNSHLFAGDSQFILKHSPTLEGLLYSNGRLKYLDSLANPVFFLNWKNGNGFFSGNLGINNQNPRARLAFDGNLGQKIALWDDGNPAGNNYGLGVQSGLLQVHTYSVNDDIVFGYGSSANLVERVRFKGNGFVGIGINPEFILDVNNRIRLRSGAGGNTAGMWLNNANNTATQSFIGIENDTYAGIYSHSSGWSFGMNTSNGDVKIMSRLGIGTTTPNAPLTFPNVLGKKITLYPGGTGDVGFAVDGNLLKIYADHPNADIAFGYDQAGIFTERFRMRANGTLSVNGNAGNPGQVLQSNGGSSSPTWTSTTNALYNNTVEITNATPIILNSSNGVVDLPGMTYTFTVGTNAKVFVSYAIPLQVVSCAFCGVTQIYMDVVLNGGLVSRTRNDVANGSQFNYSSSKLISVGPGTHTVKLATTVNGNDVAFSGGGIYVRLMNIQIIPQ